MADRPHVLIVGAGIIGASIAWHLLRTGARVTVVEAGDLGGLATRTSWGWINASWGNPEPYFRLRIRAMEEWRRLARELPGIEVAWVGGLIWDMPPAELEAYAVEHESWGYDLRRVDRAEAQRLEPQLAAPPEFAVHVAGEGAVEPLATAQTLLAAARDLGARIITNSAVRSLELSAGRVTGVETEGGRLAADKVVVAAGIETAALLGTVGMTLPVEASPGVLVATKPAPKLLNGLIMAPDVHLRQTADRRLLGGADFGGSDPGDDADAVAADIFAEMAGLLRSGDTLEFESYTVGQRPMPQDGFPIVGHIDKIAGLTVAVMHSGITLAPAIGRFVAEEITTGQRDALLDPYGPARFS